MDQEVHSDKKLLTIVAERVWMRMKDSSVKHVMVYYCCIIPKHELRFTLRDPSFSLSIGGDAKFTHTVF